MLEEELPCVSSKGWAEMIRKVYEVDPMYCPRNGGRMEVVAFLTEYAVVDRITRHLELMFVAEKPPPVYVFEQPALMAAEERGEWSVLVWRLSGVIRPIILPPEAGSAQFRDMDIRAKP